MGLDAEDLQEIIDDFVVEAGELLDQLDQDLVALENNPHDESLLNRIFRNLHTIKGTANFLNSDPIFAAMAEVGHAAEDVIGEVRGQKLPINTAIMDAILESIDTIKQLFAEIGAEKRNIPPVADLVSKLRRFLEAPAEPQAPKLKAQSLEKQTVESPLLEQVAENTSESSTDLELDEEEIREIVGDFLIEAKEFLEQLDQDLVNLESQANDQDLLNRIFRSLHTIKGTANFLNADDNFKKTAQLTHAAEDIIGAMRSKELVLNARIMDTLLATLDMIKGLIRDIEEGKTSSLDPQSLIAQLQQFQKPIKAPATDREITAEVDSNQGSNLHRTLSEEDRQELLHDFFEESKELLEKIDALLLKFEQTPKDQKLLDELFRCVHTLKGTSSFLGFNLISQLAHTTEDIFKDLRKGAVEFSRELLDTLLAVVDLEKQFFFHDKKEDAATVQVLIKQLKQFTPTSVLPLKEKQSDIDKPEATPDTSTKQMPKASGVLKSKTRKTSTRAEHTIRVETDRLDKLMNLAGEMVLGRNRLSQVVRTLQDKLGDDRICQDLLAAVDFINFVTSDLQMAVLKTRMQPIGKIFNRFNRTVRDLARELGKEVKLVIQGADTEMDKSVIDELGDPLMHLLRNAVDHGVEPAQTRKLMGKPEIATIALSAFHQGNHILIELRDDGKGINFNAVKKKAIERGLISGIEIERLPEKQICEFIFAPGFSTASEVTNVSGRGVGMDVVKSNIEKLNGSIDVSSEIGRGTTFTIHLPLTLAILQALQVEVGSENFAIPLAAVEETVRVYPHQVQIISGKEVIRFRDMIIPLIRLASLFNINDNGPDAAEKMYVVVAGIADKKIGIIIDKIVRQEEIVIKSLGKLLENTQGISGACIDGDGRVTMILDIAGLMRLLPRSTIMATPAFDTTRRNRLQQIEHSKPQEILLVEDSRSERKRTRLLVESKGFKVIEATDGKDALSKLAERQVDMIITDIEMPELDGYQLTAKIRENRKYSNIPVVAISSHKEMVDRIKGMEAGINNYLPKPIQEEQLFTVIKNLIC